MNKPVIGLTCNFDTRDTVGMSSCMGIAGQDWDFVTGDYVYALEKAGAIPVILPRMKDMKTLAPFLDTLDGVLVSGGHDVDPRSYNTRISGKCGRIVPERDEMDLFITHYAYDHKKPLLGICRGIQIMDAAFGGTLYQDLESEGPYMHHFMDNSPRQCPVHKNTLEAGSLLAKIYGKTEIQVNSYHHQAVKTVGPAVTVTAHSEDGVIEGIEVEGGHPFTVGVQWHPEMMYDSEEQAKIFKAFVEACKK